MSETQPLLARLPSEPSNSRTRDYIIGFDHDRDTDNPLNWRTSYKWGIVALLAFMAFTVAFSCISVVPVANRIVLDLDHGRSSKTASVLLVTVWELGEAAGPLIVAPLSEMFGRSHVMNAANILFIAATVLAALCQSVPLFIAARALTGFAVATNVLNPAIVGDLFIPEQRGSAMSLIMLAPLLGGAIGPAVGGAVAQRFGWRSILWASVVLAGLSEAAFFLCFRETYKVTILRQKAARLRKETGDTLYKSRFDVEDSKGFQKLRDSMLRPAIVLYGSGVLQMLCVIGSVVFAYFYVMSTTLPDILDAVYGLSPDKIGYCFVAFSIGSAISVVILNLTLDRIFIRLRDSRGGIEKPEYRLPWAIFGSITLPLVVILYGWTAQKQFSLILLLVSVGLIGSTLMLAFIPLMSYVVDATGAYSASAVTALIVCRCLAGTFLPLLISPLVDPFGYGIGFTVFGVATMCLVPIPILVMRYGNLWRQRSKYTDEDVTNH